ncbi:MAG: ABC transporter ATP-binding protein [Eubacteriales bacterium]
MSTQTDYIVEMKHVTKRFPGIVANDDVSLQIKQGEIFALLGENGAGKSTMMSMLFGMYEPDEGEIFIRGKKERIPSPAYATKLNIGMVHQHFKLVPNYTVTENIILGLECKDKLFGFLPTVNLKKYDDTIAELSKRYHLEVDPTQVIETMNVSIQQRVEILKMLYREAEILIFDEPTAVLTPQEITYLLQIIRELRDSGKTIILITHKLEEIKMVADRCAVLNHGKLIGVYDVASTTTKEMASYMVGREISFQLEKAPMNVGKPVLEVKNLTVLNRNKFPVVKDVSFTVHAGEIFAIAGVSGNGQVEIADAIFGMAQAESGTILLNREDITQLSIRERTQAGISYVPEDRQVHGLVLELDLKTNLASKSYYKEPFSKKHILQQSEFEQFSEKMIKDYDIRCAQGGSTTVRAMSGGNQQKAIIAREVENPSDLMIVVQPTRGLDIGAIENIHRQIVEERDKGRAILLISLELDEVMDCTDTIGVIYSGEMQEIAAADSLTHNQVGEFMMGVKSHEAG